MKHVFLTALLAALGCAGDRPPSDPPDTSDCGAPIGGLDPIVAPGGVALFGEMHGTVEGPTTFGRIACHAGALAGARGTIVGLEISEVDQPVLDAYYASTEDDVAALLHAEHFSRGGQDGRSSHAMLALLHALRGVPGVHVVAFDADYETMRHTPRDQSMARNVMRARQRHPDATVLTYSGGFHNRTIASADDQEIPMGVILRERWPELVSLGFASAGGTMWACVDAADGGIDCGVHPVEGRDRGGAPFVERFETRDANGYDGVWYVGPATASPPASPALASRTP